MATHQAAHTAVASCAQPVLDALSAHTKLLGNDLELGSCARASTGPPPACSCHDACDRSTTVATLFARPRSVLRYTSSATPASRRCRVREIQTDLPGHLTVEIVKRKSDGWLKPPDES
jgi:hypothetical protein